MSKRRYMKKSDINNILKQFEPMFVHATDGGYSFNPKKHYMTDVNGKKFKGIVLSTHSPMDRTNAAQSREDSLFNDIRRSLVEHVDQDEMKQIISEMNLDAKNTIAFKSGKKIVVISAYRLLSVVYSLC